MIKELHIKNFQSHKNTSLEFCEGVNAIIGETDSGKSAIIRALRLLVYNKPTGDSYRSNWGGDTLIKAIVKDHIIERIKTNSKNLFILDDAEFNSYNEEISSVLNMDEINLQKQLDNPFLLSETSGVVSSHFNRVANLEKIDTALQKANQRVRKINSEVEYLQEQKELKNNLLQEYANIEGIEIKLKEVEHAESNLNLLQESEKTLSNVLTQLNTIQEGLDEFIYYEEVEQIVDSILVMHSEHKQLKSKVELLTELYNYVEYIKTHIKEFENYIPAETEVNQILKLYENKKELNRRATLLDNLCSDINYKQKQLKTAENDLKDLEEDFKENFPDICPLCNSKIK